MADATREHDAPQLDVRETGTNISPDATSEKKQPKHDFPKSQVGKLWDAFGNPEEPVNIAPGAKYESTGRKLNDGSSITAGLKGLSLNHAKTFYRTQCGRDSLLLGIGAGFGIGGVKAVLGGRRAIWPACNWAVFTFAATAAGSHFFCAKRRREELDGMKQAVELMREIKLKKQREKDQRKADEEAAARLAEEERKRKSWTNLSNYKFW